MDQLSGASSGWAKMTCFCVENPWSYTRIACGFLLEPDHFGSNTALSPNWVQTLNNPSPKWVKKSPGQSMNDCPGLKCNGCVFIIKTGL